MIVPFPPGGAADGFARVLAERMRSLLERPVIIENISGADGSIGVGRAARARPDGYTIDLGTMATNVLNGAFYSLQYDVFTGARQLVSGTIGLTKITTLASVESAILKIKEQGEGTDKSPSAADFGGELAHYYKFGEIYNGQTFIKTPEGKWDYKGDVVPWPAGIYPMAPVPKGGYAESHDFDVLFSAMLANLQDAWANADQAKLSAAIAKMRSLGDAARSLMQKPLPSGDGNFGPCFRLV